MIRLAAVLVVLGVTVGSGSAQDTAMPVKKLTISPAAETRPALKYELLPALREKSPGNAALAYFRAFLHRPTPQLESKLADADQKQLSNWETVSLDELPTKAVSTRVDTYRNLLRDVELAAQCDRCNWEMETRVRKDGIAALLPELQPSRELIRYLSLRTRLELAEKRFDDAEKSLKCGLQMAKYVGEGPSLIQLLVGLALQSIMMDRVEEWISRPNSPNLYWALSTLPNPLIDPRVGFQGEALYLDAMVPNLAKLRSGPLPKEDASRIVVGIIRDLGRLGGELKVEQKSEIETSLGSLGFAGYVMWQYPTAKQELLDRGRLEKDVAEMPGAQAVFLNSLERFFELRDAQAKWIGTPYYQARPQLRAADRNLATLREKYRTDLFFSVFSMVIPAYDHVMFAVARTNRRMALLQTMEAIRMHAATNGGNPPKELAEVKIVPVPMDPITGKAFGYELKDRTAILTANPPEGDSPTANNSARYELLFR